MPGDPVETHSDTLILVLTLKGMLLHNVPKQANVTLSGRQALVCTPLVPRVNAPKIRATYFVRRPHIAILLLMLRAGNEHVRLANTLCKRHLKRILVTK